MKKLHLVLAAVAALAIALAIAMGGCSGNNDAPPVDNSGGSSSGSAPGQPPNLGNGSCATPAQGCPCSTEGVLIQCGEVTGQGPNGPTCAMGVRRCLGGSWSACSTMSAVTPEELPRFTIQGGFNGAPDGGWPLDSGGCTPCDPYCQQTNDVPLPDGGFTAADGGPLYQDAHLDGPPSASIIGELLDAGIDAAGSIYHELPVGSDSGPTDNPFLSLSFSVNSVDVYFLVNSTVAAQASFDNLAGLMAGDAGVIAQVNRDIPGVAYGLGRFTNYESWPYASQSTGNVLFENRQALTLDPNDTITTAAFTAMKNGTGGSCSGGTCFQTTPYVQAQASMSALYIMATNENDLGWADFAATASPDWWWNVYSYYGQNGGAGQAEYFTPGTCAGKLGTLGAPCFRSNAFHIVLLMQSAPAQEGISGSFPYYQTKPRYFPPTLTADYTTENSWYWWYSPSLGGTTVSPALAQEPSWAASTAYAVGNIVQPSPPNGFYYAVTSIAGTGHSGSTQPTWPLTAGGTVIDNAGANQVVWTATPQYVVDNYTAGNASDLTLSNVGHTQVRFGHVLPNVTTWAASKAVELNTTVVVSGSAGTSNNNPNGLYYQAITAGTTGATGPTWPTTAGVTVADGTVTWACMGPTGQAPAWLKSTKYNLGAITQPQTTANGYLYVVTTAGTTAATQPAAFGSTVKATACPAGSITDGTVGWTCVGNAPQAMAAWAANTSYPLNSIVMPPTFNGFYYIATTAGTSGLLSQPIWPLTDGATVTDGLLTPVTWTAIELGAQGSPWQVTTAVTAGTVLAPVTPNGFYYLVTTAGTTGTTPPSCTTTGQSVTDSSAVEECVPAYAVTSWTKSTSYVTSTLVSASEAIVSGFLGVPNGSLYQATSVTSPGVTAGSPPSWPAPLPATPTTAPSPSTVADNNVTWTWTPYNLANRYQLGGTSTANTTAYSTYEPSVAGGTLIDPSTGSPVPWQQCTLGSALLPVTNTNVTPNKVSSGAIGTGADVAWDFTVGAGGQHYWFDTTGTAYDTVLYIVNLADNDLMACADDSFWWLSAENFGMDGQDDDTGGAGPARTSSGTIGFGALDSAITGWLPAGHYRLVMDKFDNTPVPAPNGTTCASGGTTGNQLYSCDGDPGIYQLNMWPDMTDPGMAGNPKFTAVSTPGYSQTLAALGASGPLGQNTYVMGLDLSGVACGDSASSWEDNYTLWSLQNLAQNTQAAIDAGAGTTPTPQVFSVQSNGTAGPATIPVTPVNTATCVAGANIGVVVGNAIQNFANDLAGQVHVFVTDSDDLTDFDGTYIAGNPAASTAGPEDYTPQNVDDATFVTGVTVGPATGCSGATNMTGPIVGASAPATLLGHDTGAGYTQCNPGSTPNVTVTFGVPAGIQKLTVNQIFHFFVSIKYGQTVAATTPVIIVVPAAFGGFAPASDVTEFSAAGVCGANQEVVWGTYFWNQGPPCQATDGGLGNCVPLENPPTINNAVDSNIIWYVTPGYTANQFNDAGIIAYQQDGGPLAPLWDGGMPGELPYPMATAEYITQTGAVNVAAFLENPGDAGPIVFGAPQYLQVRALLNPTADLKQSPTLENYNLTVSCKDSQ